MHLATFPIWIALLPGLHALHWTDRQSTSSNVVGCYGSNVTFNWNVSLATGDSIVDVRWLVSGQSEELIAIYTGGGFHVMPAFSDRVKGVSYSGMTLTGLALGDTGNYFIEMTGQTSSGNMQQLRRSTSLTVLAGYDNSLLTLDGQMHAFMGHTPLYRNASGQWHLVLTCGIFTYKHRPDFDLQWTTPSGAVLPSTDYQDGQFVLALPNPVEGGRYTCALTAASAHGACLHPGTGGSGGTPGVDVDGTQARLTLLEAGVAALVAENRELKERVESCPRPGSSGESSCSEHAPNPDTATTAVSFHARQPRAGSVSGTLVMEHVESNQGNGYNVTSGEFVAPRDGTYFFLAHVETLERYHFVLLRLLVDGVEADLVSVYQTGINHQQGSVHAVLPLTAGQRVWLSLDNRYHNLVWQSGAAFSGFLIRVL